MTREEADRSRPTDTQGSRGGDARWRSTGRVALVSFLTVIVLFFLFQLGWSYFEDGRLDGNSVLGAAVGALVFGVLWGSFMWFVVWRRAGHRGHRTSSSTKS